jgi:LPS export ABC transporter permease LptG/LPS export ABC transporter permease LptF
VRILSRYILREVISHALLGGAVFTFVIFMRDLGRLLDLVVRNSAPLPSVAEIFFLTVPTALTVTIPMGVLVGILIGLSRLAADSEVTAMRASGIGVFLFVQTLGLVAVLAWGLATLNTVFVAPRSAAALADLQARLKSSQVSFEVQPRVFYEDFKNYVLYVEDASASESAAVWRKIFLVDISTPNAPKITLAEEGVLVSESPQSLHLHLLNGSTHETDPRQPDQYSISTFSESDFPIPIPPPENKAGQFAPIAQLTTGQLMHDARGLQASAKSNPQGVDATRLRWYSIELHRRFALPAACLVLAAVGIPLGLSAKKGGKATGFVLTIALVFVYYFISLGGVSMARQDTLSPGLGVWIGNLVFFAAGVGLLLLADRRPLEVGFGSLWASLKQFFRRDRRSIQDVAEPVIIRRRFFSANFPQILDDYVLRDFVLYLALVLATFIILTLVFTFFELLGDILRNRVSLATVGEYLLRVVPSAAYEPLTPLSVLIAVLVTFGLMEKANEITAMKANGISVYRIVLPVLVLAGVIAGALFFFEEVYLPDTNKRQEALRNSIKGKPAQTFLRPDRKWIFGQANTIYYYEFFDAYRDTFGNISVFEFDPATFALTKRIFATHAHWENDLNKFVFDHGWSRSFQGAAIEQFQAFDVTTFSELRESKDYFKKEVKQSSEMNFAELKNYIQDLQQGGFDVVRLKIQLYKKLAYPLITLVMAVLAVPFSLRAARHGALAGVAVALGLAVLYWVTSGLFESLGNVNQLPPALAAWSPDLLFALAGGYLILKVPT